MANHSTRRYKQCETAVALAIYGDELSSRDRKIARAYVQGRKVQLIAHIHKTSVVNVYTIINKLRNRLI